MTTVSRRATLAMLGAALVPAGVRAQSSPIRIAAALSDPYTEPYYSLDAGMYKAEGLDVELTTFSNAGEIIQAMAGGAIDIGLADMIQVANAYNHGLPYAFFAGAGLYTSTAPTTVLCVAKDGPVKTPKDLEGKTVAVVALQSISSLSVQEWLRQNGADTSTIKIFEMPFSPMTPALTRGTIAAAFIAEPFLSSVHDDVRWLGKAYDAIAKQFYVAAMFASRDWLTKNPDLARRVQRATYATARWANANHDASAVVLSKYSKLPVDRIHSMTRATFATTLDPKLMQPVLDLALKYNLIEKPVAAASLIQTV
jgi:NitT/TauT family transport system substrate-binding protein